MCKIYVQTSYCYADPGFVQVTLKQYLDGDWMSIRFHIEPTNRLKYAIRKANLYVMILYLNLNLNYKC